MARELPGVEVKPVVGHLDLVPINDFLLEDTVTVSQTVAPRGEVERCKTVEETSGKTTETTVAKGSVMLLRDHIFNTETELGKTS